MREHHAIHVEDPDHSRPRAALAPLLLAHQRTVPEVSKMVTDASHSTRLTQVLLLPARDGVPGSFTTSTRVLVHHHPRVTVSLALSCRLKHAGPRLRHLSYMISNETPLIPYRHLCPAASSTRALARCRMIMIVKQ